MLAPSFFPSLIAPWPCSIPFSSPPFSCLPYFFPPLHVPFVLPILFPSLFLPFFVSLVPPLGTYLTITILFFPPLCPPPLRFLSGPP